METDMRTIDFARREANKIWAGLYRVDFCRQLWRIGAQRYEYKILLHSPDGPVHWLHVARRDDGTLYVADSK